MSAGSIALLGAVAGLTIFLGLPFGRVRSPMPKVKALLNATAIGILVFLLWDVLDHAWSPASAALSRHDYAVAVRDGGVMVACVGIGLLGLVYFDRWVARRAKRARMARPEGPGAAVAAARQVGDARSAAAQLSLLIAIGIGLHNFGEGLAIGNSAAAGQLSLALLLGIGFGTHNATEGFGIVAPLAAAADRPSWGRLALLGLIGGGPTFLGTLVGQQGTSEVLSIAFLALAAGSIFSVVIELLAVAPARAVKEITAWGILLGLLLGFLTDAIVTAAGG